MKRKTSETKRKTTQRALSLPKQLSALASADLVRLTQRKPALEYLFRHGLVQDAAYQSLLKADRRMLHQLVGETLESLYPKQLDELAPMLAHHFNEAGDDARALHYFTRAGDEAARIYANAEAIMHYTHALNLAKGANFAKVSEPSQSLQHLFMQRGRALELSGRYDEALANYIELETWARAHAERSLVLAALMSRATIHSAPTAKYDVTQAQALSEQALVLARELQDRAAEAKILWNLMLLHKFMGQDQAVRDYGEQSLALARELGFREQLAFTLNDLAFAYIGDGRIAHSYEVLTEASALWRELDNQPMLADSLTGTAMVLFLTGEFSRALPVVEEAYQISVKIGNLWGQSYSRWHAGTILMEQGDWGAAIAAHTDGYELGDRAGFVVASVSARAQLARLYGDLGDSERGIALAQQAVLKGETIPTWQVNAYATLAMLYARQGQLDAAATALHSASANSDPFNQTMYALAQCEVGLIRQAYAEVVALTEQMIQAMRQVGLRPFLAAFCGYRGLALLAQQRWDEAETVLQTARADAEVIGARPMLWRIYAALSEVATQRGNLTEAQAFRHQARDVIAYLVEHCPPDMRASFLNVSEVRAVMSAG